MIMHCTKFNNILEQFIKENGIGDIYFVINDNINNGVYFI